MRWNGPRFCIFIFCAAVWILWIWALDKIASRNRCYYNSINWQFKDKIKISQICITQIKTNLKLKCMSFESLTMDLWFSFTVAEYRLLLGNIKKEMDADFFHYFSKRFTLNNQLLRPFGDLNFCVFSLLKIRIGWVQWCIKV